MGVDYSRIHRLLKIITLVQGGDGWTAARLAKECEATTRTIYRDLRALESVGIPYFYDDQRKCYAIRRDYFMPPVHLTLDESLALAALVEHVGAKEQIPFTHAAGKALAKIRISLPPAIRSQMEDAESHLSIKLAAVAAPEAAADVYTIVRRAIASRRLLECVYESTVKSEMDGRGAGDKPFRFAPYALFFGQRAWYAIGLHATRREVRTLKLNRFSAIRLIDERYQIPKDFSIEKHLGHAWRMIRGKKRYAVELTFDREFAETISDTHWHGTQEIFWEDDGSIRFQCSVDGLDEIVWWILSMGPHCKVHKPAELARRVRDEALATSRLYAQDRLS